MPVNVPAFLLRLGGRGGAFFPGAGAGSAGFLSLLRCSLPGDFLLEDDLRSGGLRNIPERNHEAIFHPVDLIGRQG